MSRTIIIKVTAEDGITSLQYSITFALLPNEDAGLLDLRLDGISIDGFNPDILHYNVQVDSESGLIPLADYTTRDDGATAEIFEATSLTGDSISRTTIVKVTAEDQITNREYTVTFNLSISITEVKNNINVYLSRGILTIVGINEPEIDIFNLSGMKIKSAKNVNRINMQDVSNGIYFVRINGTSLVFKVYKTN